MPIRDQLAREARVAFSPRAQPVWFRVLKWVVFLALIVRFWRSPTFWYWVLGAFALSLALHLLWRYKTRQWTQPWGGWSDVQAADRREPRAE